MSRSLMVALLAAGCVTAAAGGSYLAVRQSAAQLPAAQTAPFPAPAPDSPVEETEGVIEAPASQAPVAQPGKPEPPAPEPQPRRRALPRPKAPQPVMRASDERRVRPESAEPKATRFSAPLPEAEARPELAPLPAETPIEPAPVESALAEVVIPASAVIGLAIETTVTSERARIEDRVEARVTRDVFADGRLALPAGSRVTGVVTLVERGGKVRDRARLGVRFHTVVLANGRQMPLRTEPIYREGESPTAESSRKIGGAAIGGAVLGAILGGGKGAIAGATAGAAGGTAAVINGDRNAAVLPGGSIVTVKLASPLTIDVGR